MTDKVKKAVRDKIKEENWNVIYPAGETPISDQVVTLMYENTKGQPCECYAQYIVMEPGDSNWWKGASPHVKGRRMVNLIAWKAVHKQEATRAYYIVSEWRSECDSQIEMRWEVDKQGFQAFCPVCGKRLMLCGECRQRQKELGFGSCDYDAAADSCWRSKEHGDE